MPGFIYNKSKKYFIDVAYISMVRIIIVLSQEDRQDRYELRARIDGSDVCIYSDTSRTAVMKVFDEVINMMRCGRPKDLPLILGEQDDT